MAKSIEDIVENIKSELEDAHPNLITEMEGNPDKRGIVFLLKTACEYNLLQDLHDLLELNQFGDIDQNLILPHDASNGLTLLGLAAFHGHIEIVSYLVEVRLANLNKKDSNGNTPLHQVVYGDSHPFNHLSNGVSHEKVAKYLIKNYSDLSINNHKEQTPYESSMSNAPLAIEGLIGRRFITNTGSALYYADKVRPILQKELDRQQSNMHYPKIENEENEETVKATEFKQFCFEHAIEMYVKENKFGFGYTNINQLRNDLALVSTTQEKRIEMEAFLSSQEPAPFSSKQGLISTQLPRILKQSASSAAATALFTYYVTQDIVLSVAAGSLSAMIAWQYLTEIGYKQKMDERKGEEDRVNTLRNGNGFFTTRNQNSTYELRIDSIFSKR